MSKASRTTTQLKIHEVGNVDTQDDANDPPSTTARTEITHVDGYEVTAHAAHHTMPTPPTTAPPPNTTDSDRGPSWQGGGIGTLSTAQDEHEADRGEAPHPPSVYG